MSSTELKVDVDFHGGIGWNVVMYLLRAVVGGGKIYVTGRGLHFRFEGFRFEGFSSDSLRIYYGDDPSRLDWDFLRKKCCMENNILFNYKYDYYGNISVEERVWDVWGLVEEIDSKRLSRFFNKKNMRKKRKKGEKVGSIGGLRFYR